jgi:hypothetical protein
MFFSVENRRYMSEDYFRASTLLNAYYIIQKYPMKASDLLMDQFIEQQYKTSLKNLCIKLLLDLTFYRDNSGNFVLMFKDPQYDKIARLITYGNEAIPGSNILRIALSN